MATEHPGKIAARLSHQPNVAARASGVVRAEVRAIRELQLLREKLRSGDDPLLVAKQTRPYRTASKVALSRAREEAREAEFAAEVARAKRAADHAEGVRKSMLAAAQMARDFGIAVRKSTDRNGRVSSYYCSAPGGEDFRISDHEIPWTAQRDGQARAHGHSSYTGFHGSEIIIDEPRSETWLRRAIILARAGRI
ncbi:MAG: hypothetical protein KGZ69_13550 [Methylomonas sp.]|nr:hypothetical protein [Methylomonas sp.]